MRRLGTFEPFQFSYPGRYWSPDGVNIVPLPDFVPVNGRPVAAGAPAVYDPRTCGQRKKSGHAGCKCHGKCGSCRSGMAGLGYGRRGLYIPRGLRGLGDDGSGDSGVNFDSGGNWADVGGGGDSIFGSGAVDGGTSFFDPGLTAGGSPDTTAAGDSGITAADLLALQGPGAGPDAGFTATLDPSTGQFTLPDGSSMNPTTGQILQPDGTDVFPDGSKVLPDGTYVDARGNVFPADSGPAMVAQQQTNSGRPSGGGSGGGSGFSSGGGSKGGGSSQQQQQQLTQLQLMCMQNPRLAICQSSQAQLINALSNTAGTLLAARGAGITPAQFAAQQNALGVRPAQASTGFSFSSIPTWGWILLAVGGGIAAAKALG